MSTLVEYTFGTLALICWLAGISVAHGATQTFFAIVVAPYAWYLVLTHLM